MLEVQQNVKECKRVSRNNFHLAVMNKGTDARDIIREEENYGTRGRSRFVVGKWCQTHHLRYRPAVRAFEHGRLS